MVPALSLIFMIITSLITIGLPVALIIWVMKKYRPGFSPIAVGILVFFVVQIAVRIPLIQILSLSEGVKLFIKNNAVLYIFILSLTAGIFEEGGRLLGFSLFLKKRREYKHGIAYGIGHGGIEAFILVGLSYIVNIVFSVVINQGMLSSEMMGLPASITAQIQASADSLISTPSYMFLIAGLERIFSMIFHIALSVMVLYAINTRKKQYLLFALLLHTAVNFAAVLLFQYVSVWLSEACVFIVAVLSIIYILKIKKSFFVPEPLDIGSSYKKMSL